MTDEEFLKWQQQRKTPAGTMTDEEFLLWQKTPVTKRRNRDEIAQLQSELEDWRQRVPAQSPEVVLRHQIGSQTAVKPVEREKTLLEQVGDYLKAVGAGAWSKSAETAGTILDTAARLLYALGTPAPWDPQKAKQAVKPYEETALGQHFERNLAALGRISSDTAEQAEETGGLVGRVFYEAATEVPKQIALGASGKILGDLIAVGQPAWQSVARLLPFMATAGIAGARQAKQEGAKPYQQALMGLSAAGIAGATESLNLDEWLKVFGRSGGGELVLEGATRAARAGVLGKVLDWLGPWAVPVGEIVEEELEDPLTGLAKKSIYKPETPWTGPEGVFDLQRAGETAFVTGWYIVLLGAFGLPMQLKAYRMAKEMLDASKPPTFEEVEELRRQVDEDLRNLPNKEAAEIAGMPVSEQIEAMRKMREEMARKAAAETTKTETPAETRTETRTEPRPELTLEQLVSIRNWWAERAANPWLGAEADREYARSVLRNFDEEIEGRLGKNLTTPGESVMADNPNAPKVGDKYDPNLAAEVVRVQPVPPAEAPAGMKPGDEFILKVVRQGYGQGADKESMPQIVVGRIEEVSTKPGETTRKVTVEELNQMVDKWSKEFGIQSGRQIYVSVATPEVPHPLYWVDTEKNAVKLARKIHEETGFPTSAHNAYMSKIVYARFPEAESEVGKTPSPPGSKGKTIDVDAVNAEPIDQRTFDEVGHVKVKAYQFLHPELAPFIQAEARRLLEELNSTIKGEKWFQEDGTVTGEPRRTSPAIERMLEDILPPKRKRLKNGRVIIEKRHTGYKAVAAALQRIINDKGKENALAKKIEIIIDDNLTKGTKTIDGYDLPPNDEYVALKKRIEQRETPEGLSKDEGDRIRDQFQMETLKRVHEEADRLVKAAAKIKIQEMHAALAGGYGVVYTIDGDQKVAVVDANGEIFLMDEDWAEAINHVRFDPDDPLKSIKQAYWQLAKDKVAAVKERLGGEGIRDVLSHELDSTIKPPPAPPEQGALFEEEQKRRKGVFNEQAPSGRADMGEYADAKRRFERVRQLVREGVFEDRPGRRADMGGYATEEEIAGRTAIHRRAVSMPVRKLVEAGLISGRVLHHGRGRADADAEALRAAGEAYAEYDPNYAPDRAVLNEKHDTVVSNYVLNVLPPKERAEAWKDLANTTGGIAFITVRTVGDKSIKGTPYQDGVRTSKGTFQKAYTVEEFENEARKYFGAVQLVFGSDKSGSATFCVMHGAEKSAGYQVAYTDANGKGHTKFFDTVEEMEAFIRKLRHPAIVKNASGEQIGRVWFDDGRWQWYHEAEEPRASRHADMGGYADQGDYANLLGSKKQEETQEGAPKRPERDREYAERLRVRIELPELVEMAKELLEGKYPRVRERLGRMLGRALLPQGSGEARVDLRADIFIGPVLEQQVGGDRAEFEQRIAEKYGDDLEDIVIKSYYNRKTRTTTYIAYRKDPDFAAKVLGHEIGHVVDWLEDKELRRGNILGHLASFKHYMEKFLAEYPGAPESATLTDEDRARLKAEAARIVEEEKKAQEPQGVEGTGITAQDILDIFNTVSGGEKNPALLTYIKSLSPAEKISIVKQALKGIVAPGVIEGVARVDTSKRYTDWDKRLKTVFERLVKEELAKRQLYSEEVIRKELKDLTLTWKPFTPRKNDPYTRYRFSSPELYADAFSVLVNEPELLQKIAPTFYRAFFNWFEQKPHVKRLYDRIQERIGNIEEILDTRLTKDYEMLAAGHAERKRLREARRSLIKGFGYTVMRWLVDKNQGTLGTVRAIERQSGTRWLTPRKETTPEAFAARRVRTELEEAAHIADEVGNYVHSVGEVLKILNDAGLWVDDLGVYMLHMRAATERSTMANPRGTTETTSKDALDRMRERLGEDRFAALEKAADTYRRIREELIIPRAEQSRMYSPRLISVMKNSKHYARFSVIKYLQKRYGTAGTARVYRQIGTLEEIENPFVATVIQDMSVLRAAKLNEAKLAVINMLSGLPDAIRPAKTRWSKDLNGHEALEPDEPGLALFSVMLDGKLESFYVSESIAKDFERAPFEAHKVAEVLRLMFNPVKQALVSKNVLWMARNVWKDFKGTVLKNPEIRLRDIPKLLGYYIKVHREVVNEVFKGERSEHIEEMMRRYMLIPHRAYTGKDYDYETEIDRLADEFGVNPRQQAIEAKEARTALGRFWRRVKTFWDWLEKPGRYTEVIAKVAGERFLTERTQLSAQEVSHRVRTRVGTPDPRRTGSAHQLTNNVWIFSNIGKEGMRASWEAFREDPGAYIWKAVWLSVMPKLALAAAGSAAMAALLRKLGVRDPERWKRIIDAIPEYDKQNYQCVPLAMTKDGRAIYLRLPEDYDGQFWGKLAWTLVHGKFTGKQSATAAIVEQSPYDANPYLVIGAQWIAFLQGQNPIDEYYGTPVIPEQEFAAGGIEPFLTMLKRTVGELGGDAIYRPARRDEREGPGELLLRIFPINMIGQFIKITDAGTKEKFYEEQAKIEQERARRAVTIRRRVQEAVKQAKGRPSYETIEQVYTELTDSGIIDAAEESIAQFTVNRFYPYAASRMANPSIGALLKLRSVDERSRMLRRLKRSLQPEEYREVLKQLDDLGVPYYE